MSDPPELLWVSGELEEHVADAAFAQCLKAGADLVRCSEQRVLLGVRVAEHVRASLGVGQS